MHHIQCNWYTSVWDACGLCYFAQVLPAVLLYCCGLAFLGLVAWSQFCGYRSAARLMRSRITRILLLFSKQFESETSFRSNLRSSWLLGGPNWTEVRTELTWGPNRTDSNDTNVILYLLGGVIWPNTRKITPKKKTRTLQNLDNLSFARAWKFDFISLHGFYLCT